MKGTLMLACMRNEGAFVLEWLAWNRMLGFEKFLIMHNDCTDRMPQLLRLLERHGVLAAKRHHPKPDETPLGSAYKAARSHPFLKQCDWMFSCDVDEYLVIRKGNGTIDELIGNGAEERFRGMSIHWLIFGTGDEDQWEDRFVHQRFLKSAPEKARQKNCVKSFDYKPLEFGRLRSHAPKFWRGAGKWDTGSNHWVFSDESWFEDFHPTQNALNGSHHKLITHKAAHLNHYILQTKEQFAFKKGSPGSAGSVNRYTDDFFNRFNHISVENPSTLVFKDRFDAEYAKLIAIPGVLRLHHLYCADLVKAMCAKRGDNHQKDPRFVYHKDMAQSLPKPEPQNQTA